MYVPRQVTPLEAEVQNADVISSAFKINDDWTLSNSTVIKQVN